MTNKSIEEVIAELMRHTAIQYADAAIGLQAARTGSAGYEGPDFRQALREGFIKIYNGALESCDSIPDMVCSHNKCHCEEICDAIDSLKIPPNTL